MIAADSQHLLAGSRDKAVNLLGHGAVKVTRTHSCKFRLGNMLSQVQARGFAYVQHGCWQDQNPPVSFVHSIGPISTIQHVGICKL